MGCVVGVIDSASWHRDTDRIYSAKSAGTASNGSLPMTGLQVEGFSQGEGQIDRVIYRIQI